MLAYMAPVCQKTSEAPDIDDLMNDNSDDNVICNTIALSYKSVISRSQL